MHNSRVLTPAGHAINRSFGWIRTSFAVLGSAVSMFIIINHVFYLGLLGRYELQSSYLYFLMAIFIAMALLVFPKSRQDNGRSTLWLVTDIVLAAVTFGICVYFALKGYDILMKGWGASAPAFMTVLSVILWAIILEASRRTGGLALALVAGLISIYPLFAGKMPGLLQGADFSFSATVAYHILSPDSILGIPLTVCGNILVGYMIFGVTLTITGGGDFFFKLSLSLLGHTRGGVAKVAALASAFFGSLSGSAVSNVVSTGSITIPMMIKTGYRPYFAAAVEACASNGGQLMPPVMGAVAFVMASFLNMAYIDIAIAAVIPSLLYYFGILVQVDGYAVNHGLKGLPRDQLPSLKKTFREGWFYLFSLIFLVVLLAMGMEIQSPYYTSVFLILIAAIRHGRKMNPKKIKEFFEKFGQIMSQLVPMLCAVGMIMGSLGMTGVAHAFPSELVRLAGGSLPMMLILGALSSFILGMGMTAIAVYVFLAVIMAPAMTEIGLNPLAVHLFLLYWGLLSFITPPVCIAVYPAATIAGASSMRSGFAAMRLGLTAFVIPFFFVLDPALILHGTAQQIFVAVAGAFMGVFLLASALEGYMIGIGRLGYTGHSHSYAGRYSGFFVRGVLFSAGFLLALPGAYSDAAGAVLVACFIFAHMALKRKSRRHGLSTLDQNTLTSADPMDSSNVNV